MEKQRDLYAMNLTKMEICANSPHKFIIFLKTG